MSTLTTYLNMVKPSLTDKITDSVNNYNSNLDILDANINTLNVNSSSQASTISSIQSQLNTNTNNISYLLNKIPSSFCVAEATIPSLVLTTGWYRVGKIQGLPSNATGTWNYPIGFLLITGSWNYGAPAEKILMLSWMHNEYHLKDLGFGRGGYVSSVRITDTTDDCYLDAYCNTLGGPSSESRFLLIGSLAYSETYQPTVAGATEETYTATVNF